MHPVPLDLINRFRVAQDRAVATIVEALGGTLGVRLPTSNRDWLTVTAECGLYNVRWLNGVEIYAHGFGIELIFPDLVIDFDWGDAGEPDGFDAWRLWIFAKLNNIPLACSGSPQVRDWLDEAVANGELTRDTSLDYSPAHRAHPVADSYRL
jgi:hypothetical protein